MVEISKIELNDKNIDSDPKTKIKTKKKIPKVLLVILGFVIALGFLAGLITITTLPIVAQVKKMSGLAQDTYATAKSQDLVALEGKIKDLKSSLQTTKVMYKTLAWTKLVPIVRNYYLDGENGFIAVEAGIEAAGQLVEAVVPYADVLGLKGKGTFTGGTAEDRIVKIVQTLNEITPKIGAVNDNLKNAQSSIDKINPNRYPETFQGKAVREQIIKAKTMIDNLSTTMAQAQPGLEALPGILGYPNSQKYLLIMQNDGELRPTGGFMTAYSVIKLESGRVILEKSDDIYSLDKKNKVRVEAPEAIKKYLFSANLKTGLVPYWYLRDMNLSPDFRVSMDLFKRYYDQIPQEMPVDGIIAIDTQVLKSFLTILGPIDIPDYGRFSMDKDSRCHDIPQVVCELEYIVDTPIPGIKASRKDVLGPLARAILNKVFDADSSSWPGIFKMGVELINQKHILFYFVDEKSQTAAEKLKIAGRIEETESGSDYLHVSDTNFGGAKSNLFVVHQTDLQVEVDGDKIINTLTLTYTNPEPMDNCNLERATGLCLNGILRNYIRIYVPKGSRLVEAIGSEEEVKTYDELEKTVFEGFFTLRGDGGKAKMVVTYELPFSYQDNYQLLIQKQPGTAGHQYTVFFGDKKEEFSLTQDKELQF